MKDNKDRKKAQKGTLLKVLKRIKKYSGFLILSILMAAVTVASTLYVPILVGRGIDHIVGPGNVDFAGISRILVSIGVIVAITALSQWIMNICNNKITYHVTRDIRDEAMEKIQKLPLRYIDGQSYGDIVSRVIADVDQFADGLLMGFTQFFSGVLTIVGTLVFMLIINVRITLVVVLITPVSFFVASFIAKKTFSMFKLQSETRGEQTAFIDEMIGGEKVVKAYGYEEEAVARFDEINERLQKYSLRAIFFSSITNPSTRFVNSLVYAGVAVSGAFIAISGGITVGQLSSFLSYANQYTKPFNEISGVITELQNALACAARMFELIEEEPELPDAENAADIKEVDGRVDLNNVYFSYTPDKKLIEDFNLHVKKGQRIAIVGPTGCGKTTTCKTLINAVLEKKKPVLIIEPAKDEWVRWAIKQNEHLPESERIHIFEPGLSSFEGTLLSHLMLNPFQPAAIAGAPIDMQTRCEKITALINATLPTGDILPVIMDEALYTYLKEKVEDFEEEEMEQLSSYPLLEGALGVAKKLLTNRGYEQRVTDSFVAALETRFKYLTRGKRGNILNQLKSTSYDTLFNKNCVINLSKIPNVKDKALIMSMILLAQYEYRMSAYSYDKEYRKHAQANELMHLTVIEEAHNVLSKPSAASEGTGNPQQVVADLFSNMLAEIRSLGEGFMIIDQVPTKLIPDVIKNTNYKICHRMTSIDDCAVIAQALALRDDQRGIIPTLEQGNAIIAGDLDDAASWVKISRPVINL